MSSHVDGTLATAVFDNLTVDQALLTSSMDLGSVGVAGQHDLRRRRLRGQSLGRRHLGHRGCVPHRPRQSGSCCERAHGPGAQRGEHARLGEGRRDVPAVAGERAVAARDGGRHAREGRRDAVPARASAESIQVAVRAGIAPEWVRLTQVEGTFKGYASEDGVTWQLIGTITVDWSGEPALAVTSHNNGALTTAVFENVQLQRFLSQQ